MLTVEEAMSLPREVLEELLSPITPEEWLEMDQDEQEWLLEAGVEVYMMEHPLEVSHERLMEILPGLAVDG